MNKIKLLIIIVVLITPYYYATAMSNSVSSSNTWNNFYIDSTSHFALKDMAIDSTDAIVVIGNVYGNNLPGNHSVSVSTQAQNGGIIKLDQNGSLLWSRYFGTNDHLEEFYKIIIDSNDNIIIAGTSYSTSLLATHSYIQDRKSLSFSNYLVKYSPTGNLLWTTVFRDSAFSTIEDIKLGVNNSIIILQGGDNSLALTIFDSQGLLIQSNSSFGSFIENSIQALCTSNSEIFALSHNNIPYSNQDSNLILTKYSSNFSEEWSINFANILPFIYLYNFQVTANNDIIIYGSINNLNTSSNDFNDYDLNLSLFSIYINNNGSIVWKSKLLTTGANYYQNSAFNSETSDVLIVGSTYSSTYPAFNSNESNYSGNGDLIFTIFNSNGNTIKNSILGNSGVESPLCSSINHHGEFIIVASSYIPFNFNSYKTIIFAVKPDGSVIDPVTFEIDSQIELVNNFLSVMISFSLIFLILTIFNVYMLQSAKSDTASGLDKKYTSHLFDNEFSLIYCPHDGSRMRTFIHRANPTAEFLISKQNIEIGLTNAVAMNKIPLLATKNIKSNIVNIFKKYEELNDITLRSFECPNCHFISANPLNLPIQITEDFKDKKQSQNSEVLSQLTAPSLLSYINPFPSKRVSKGYFKSLLTLDKSKLMNYVKDTESTKLTSLAIVFNSFFPLPFFGNSFNYLSLLSSVIMYYFILLSTSFLITGLLHTKNMNFVALDNFRLWGIILWLNLPVVIFLTLTKGLITPKRTISVYSPIYFLDIIRLFFIISLYIILLSYLSEIGSIKNILVSIIVLLFVSCPIVALLFLGLNLTALLVSLGFLSCLIFLLTIKMV